MSLSNIDSIAGRAETVLATDSRPGQLLFVANCPPPLSLCGCDWWMVQTVDIVAHFGFADCAELSPQQIRELR